MDDVTYSTVGMTTKDESPPSGFHVLQMRTSLGIGTYERAAKALFEWEMHRRTPLLHISPTVQEAAPGVRVQLRMGPLRAPCQVVWAVKEENRTGFAYGTLPGHPECGEEAFILQRNTDDSVEFTVLAVSRASAWYLKAAGPFGRWVQKAFAWQYGRTLIRLTQPLPRHPGRSPRPRG